MKKSNHNVYQMVTDRIIEQLEKSIVPWHKPWSGACLADGGAISYITRRPYSLLNQMLLGREGEYLTFKQVKELGGSVKKGAKSGVVVFFTMIEYDKEEITASGSTEIKQCRFPVLRYYNVFHISDTTGIESKIKEEEVEEKVLNPIANAEDIISGYLSREPKLTFQNDKVSGKAYYSPMQDMVVIPKLSQYEIAEEYYSTAFHEFVHSTMPAYRCDRQNESAYVGFGSEEYSREELVAEIGSAMLCNVSGIECEKAFKNSVAYINGWLKKLKGDNKAIVWASSRAERAAKYIIGQKED